MKDIRTATLEASESSITFTGLRKRHFLLRALSLAISIFMMLTYITEFDFSVNSESTIWNGTATPISPSADEIYYISTAEELAGFSQQVNSGNDFSDKTIKLTDDISLNDTSNWESWGTTVPANSWTAIGTNINSFKGIFDGQGHTISGVYINTSSNYQGLFGYCYGSTIKNVSVTKSYIKGGSFVGGVVGLNIGIITNCYNTGTVNGTIDVGGVVGENHGTITNCYNTGSVSGTDFVGGVVGNKYDTITNCYNTGTVSGNDFVGGVVGYNGGTITNCYNAGNVSGSTGVGGVVGNTGDSITNCYYLSGTASSGVGYGLGEATSKTAVEMKTDAFAILLGSGFLPDYSQINKGYPILTWQFNFQGEGTAESPYEISTANQLRYVSYLVNNDNANYGNKSYMLTADIQLNDTTDWENWGTTSPANSWTAIGTNINPFKGIFDGQGHTISGIYINNDLDAQGLFGYCYGSTIKNVGVTKSYIKGGYRIGGVVGENRGTITNSYNTGTVSGKYYIGGVVGTNNSRIINCYNTGDASGTLNKDGGVGGVVGVSYGTITNSYNTGSVSGTSSVGGVVGSNMNTNTITNCYYLSGTASSGVSSGTGVATSKTESQFKNGEVAHLLQGAQTDLIWGHTVLDGSELPILVFTSEDIKRVHKITFIDGTTEITTKYTLNSGTVSFPEVSTKTEHTFNGWIDSSTDIYTATSTFTSDKVLYSKWTANTYTITYNLNGGTNNATNLTTYTYGVGLNLASPTKIGYSFSGWFSDSAFTNRITEVNTTDVGDKTLWAKWTANTYTITYNLNDGTNNATNLTTYTYGVGLTLASPTKIGYSFSGWFSDSAFTNRITKISTTDIGDKTLFAKWTKQEPVTPPIWARQTPVITVNPISSIIVSGDSLSISTLSGGYAEVNGKRIDGKFQWVYSNILPEKSASYLVKFVPDNLDLYEQAYINIPVTVVANEPARNLTTVSNALCGITITPEEAKEADLNSDGVINIFDKVLLKRQLLNM